MTAIQRAAGAICALLAMVVAGGCSAEPSEDDVEADDAIVLTQSVDTPVVVPPVGTTLLELSQPTLVQSLEARGLGFAVHFGESGTPSNETLASRSAFYGFIADDLSADLDAQRARDPRLKTQVANGVTRILDKGWMRASYARFELTGVMNRLDRLAQGGPHSCGEVRFLYRLSYRHAKQDPADVSYSRLPVVFNVVYDVPRQRPGLEECARAANAWRVPATVQDETSYLDWLTREVAAPGRLRLKQIELDAQVLRVPSESKVDLAGVAEYAFRVYALEGGVPTLRPLENQVDAERIVAEPALKAELAVFLRSHLREVDLGTLLIPEKFLAKKVSAFSTFGSARAANKPFTRLFWDATHKRAPGLSEDGEDGVGPSSTQYVSNTAGLLARLDDLSCTGCHQGGRGVAGFHFLGEDPLAQSHLLNVARIGKSPHLLTDLARRRTFVETLASGVEPSSFRPVSFSSPTTSAPRGAPCVTADVAPPFSTQLGCERGLVCTVLSQNPQLALDLGQCLPEMNVATGSYAHEFAGLPCLKGTIHDDPSDPRKDTIATTKFACPDAPGGPGYTCRPASIGVPGGLCTKLCAPGNKPFDGENELCAYAGGKEFDECAGRNDFSRCLAGAIKAGLREACDEKQPCREDYICQRFIKARATPPEAPADGRGYCVPTYFLFQVRADGHPNPTPVR